jgi:hypothetical protein
MFPQLAVVAAKALAAVIAAKEAGVAASNAPDAAAPNAPVAVDAAPAPVPVPHLEKVRAAICIPAGCDITATGPGSYKGTGAVVASDITELHLRIHLDAGKVLWKELPAADIEFILKPMPEAEKGAPRGLMAIVRRNASETIYFNPPITVARNGTVTVGLSAAGKEGAIESLKIVPEGKGCTVSAKTSEGTLNLDLAPMRRVAAK